MNREPRGLKSEVRDLRSEFRGQSPKSGFRRLASGLLPVRLRQSRSREVPSDRRPQPSALWPLASDIRHPPSDLSPPRLRIKCPQFDVYPALSALIPLKIIRTPSVAEPAPFPSVKVDHGGRRLGFAVPHSAFRIPRSALEAFQAVRGGRGCLQRTAAMAKPSRSTSLANEA
jgi:hypothetical protein